MRTALITGVTGQDGSLLARLLLERGYRVTGTMRQARSEPGASLWRLRELGIERHEQLSFRPFELLDATAPRSLIDEVQPEEVYNLAGRSSVGASFGEPLLSLQADGAAPLRWLQAIRESGAKARFLQTSSSEMFGQPPGTPQDEDTPLRPRTPYGAAKAYAHWMTVSYREVHGLFACSAILYNHESPYRGAEFVTRKITDAVAKIRLGTLDCLHLGWLDARRDWGYAPEYVDAMVRIMRADAAGTFVLATGRSASIRDFATMAFAAAGIGIDFRGSGPEETAFDRGSGRTVIRVDRNLLRPAEPMQLVGNAARAKAVLAWEPKVSLERICAEMVEADLRRNSTRIRSELSKA